MTSETLQRPAPFDAAAPRYDETFTHSRLGRWQREQVWAELGRAFAPGSRVLELGCGTGEDALWLARRGVEVLATDSSPAMLEAAWAKAARAGLAAPLAGGLATRTDGRVAGGRVGFTRLDMAALPRAERWDGYFDGAFSNFGALNCLPEWRALGTALGRWVRPGGLVVLVLMGPLCPWELAWHALRGRPRSAVRRLRAGAAARVAPGASVRVWYPTPGRLRAQLAPAFRHVATSGLGTLSPPPYLERLATRWPRVFETLALLDRRVARSRVAGWLNDHYVMVLERWMDEEREMRNEK